jgi:hypothetical protein
VLPAFRREGRDAVFGLLWVSAHKRANLLFCLRRKKVTKKAALGGEPGFDGKKL